MSHRAYDENDDLLPLYKKFQPLVSTRLRARSRLMLPPSRSHSREYMESAVQKLWRGDFFDHLKRLQPSEHRIADVDSGEHR